MRRDPRQAVVDFCCGVVNEIELREATGTELTRFEEVLHAKLKGLLEDCDKPVTRSREENAI